ncbi:MAG: hypothetical protein V3U92_15190 [Cellulophaga sp.]
MERKKINKVLIVVVILIWGIVLYKFVSPYFKQTANNVLTAELLTKELKVIAKKKDTVALNLIDRDPFLGKPFYKKKRVGREKIAKKTSVIKVTPKIIEWPKITYLGFVKSKKNARRLGLVRVDGKLYRVNKKEVIQGVMVLDIYNEYILLVNGKEKKKFKRK